MIFKVTHHIRVNNDMNLSVTFESVVDNDEEAYKVGHQFNGFIDNYLEGYGDRGNGENKYEDED